jgi:hypothetical protein
LAAEPGFEPGLEDPKSPVLPLHNSAFYNIDEDYCFGGLRGAEGRTRTDTEIALQQFLRLSRLPLPPLRHKRKTRFELATSSLARKRSTTELLPHPHIVKNYSGAEAQNRTEDTRIFSPLLYQLSYLGTKVIVSVSATSVKRPLLCISMTRKPSLQGFHSVAFRLLYKI